MGKTVKTVLKVAAFAAIATFAAPVAGAIGLSSVVGSVVGSAVVGAAMGAATNAVLGGSVLQGALMGGLGGGLGGFSAAAQAPPAVVEGVTAAPVAGSAPAMVGVGATPLASAAGISDTVAAATQGGLSAASAAPIVVTAPTAVRSGIAAAAPGLAAGAAPIATAAGISDVVARETSPTASSLAEPVATPSQGFVAGVVPRLGDVARAVGPQLVASALSGNAQQEALAAQAQALERAQRQHDTNFNLKTQYAQQLIDDAGYLDPTVAGTRAAEAARVRAGMQGRNAAREAAAHTGALSGQQAAIQRQAELAGGRQATADYWAAYGPTTQARIATRAAGINAIPLDNPPSSSDYSLGYTNAAGDVGGTADLISRGLGAWYGRNTGDREDPRYP